MKPTEGSPRFQLDLRRTKMVDFCLPKFRKEPTLSLYCWSWVLFQTNNKIIVNLFYKCELNINKILQHLFMSGTNWHHRLLFSATGFNTWSISPRIKKHISKHMWINETNIWMCNIYIYCMYIRMWYCLCKWCRFKMHILRDQKIFLTNTHFGVISGRSQDRFEGEGLGQSLGSCGKQWRHKLDARESSPKRCYILRRNPMDYVPVIFSGSLVNQC